VFDDVHASGEEPEVPPAAGDTVAGDASEREPVRPAQPV